MALTLSALGSSAAATSGAAMKRRVTLEVHDADLVNVLRLLAEEGRFNLVLDEEVSGRVTVRLHQVRLDRALSAVLKSHGLGAEWSGDVLRVAPVAKLLHQLEVELASGRAAQQRAPLKTWIIPVNYGRAAELLPQVEATLSPRGRASVDQRTNTIIVRDVAR